jgi:hypothetical protein
MSTLASAGSSSPGASRGSPSNHVMRPWPRAPRPRGARASWPPFLKAYSQRSCVATEYWRVVSLPGGRTRCSLSRGSASLRSPWSSKAARIASSPISPCRKDGYLLAVTLGVGFSMRAPFADSWSATPSCRRCRPPCPVTLGGSQPPARSGRAAPRFRRRDHAVACGRSGGDQRSKGKSKRLRAIGTWRK